MPWILLNFCNCSWINNTIVKTQTNVLLVLIGKRYLRICNKTKNDFLTIYNTISCHECQEKKGLSQLNNVKYITFVCKLNRQCDVFIECIHWLRDFQYSITFALYTYSQWSNYESRFFGAILNVMEERLHCASGNYILKPALKLPCWLSMGTLLN